MFIMVKTDFCRDNCLMGKNILLRKMQVQAPLLFEHCMNQQVSLFFVKKTKLWAAMYLFI